MSLRKFCRPTFADGHPLRCSSSPQCEHHWFYDFRVNRRRYRNTTETANKQEAKNFEAAERIRILEGRQREIPESAYQWAQMRLGVDVARYGDDRTVIFPRQGKRAFPPKVMRHARDSAVSTDIAAAVMAKRLELRASATIMDATGGWAAGASDVLRASDAGHRAVNVQFHAPGLDQRYKNRRAEMWFVMAEWIKAGGCLPNLPELTAELSTPTYTFVNGKFQMESKEQIKERLGRSPDLADALALTFGIPEVAPKSPKPPPSPPLKSVWA